MPESVKAITCGPENVADFNAALRQHAPEAHDMAKALHKRGLISGLAGARMRPTGADQQAAGVAVRPTLSAALEARSADREWNRGNRAPDAHEAKIREMNRRWMEHGRKSMEGAA